MDANGARFWLLAGPADLVPAEEPDRVAWDADGSALRLADQRPAPALTEDEALATALREAPPLAIDGLGSRATVLPGGEGGPERLVITHPDLPDAELFATTDPLTDVAFGDDGYATVLAGGVIHLRDARTFGDPVEAWRALDATALAGLPLTAWRAAPRPGGGAWLLDRDAARLARWTGRVLRDRPPPVVQPGTFRPDPEDPETVALSVRHTGFDGDTAAALATSPGGRVAVLTLRVGAEARVWVFEADGRPAGARALAGLTHPYGLAWTDDAHVAVLATDAGAPLAEALVYPVDTDDDRALPLGQRFPLRRHDGAAFLHSPDGQATYPTPAGPRKLVPLSLPRRATQGSAVGRSLDSREAGLVWHRLMVEALVPAGCGLRVHLAASDSPTPPTDPFAWHPHDVGDVPRGVPGDRVRVDEGGPGAVITATAPGTVSVRDEEGADVTIDRDRARPTGPVARAAWTPLVSELPGHPGLLDCPVEPDRAGLFAVLIQRTGHPGSALVGRWLHVRVTLFGTGRTSPALAALRAWGPRFSYVRAYLPELYHPDPRFDGDDARGRPAPPDFLERFVAIVEGVLTPLEDRVAEASALTHPAAAPADALDWLASWVGLTLDPALPEQARRRMIALAPELHAWRGTRRGLELALEILTDGGVSRGELVVLEDWRLRRTWATILGADLSDEADPLLPGLSVSSNSLVGDTLILGEEHRREFLALYGDEALAWSGARTWRELVGTLRDRLAVARFFDETAHRATVLAIDSLGETTLGLVRRLSASLAPATVSVRVTTASRAFVVSVTALVGIDTHLTPEPPPRGVRLGSTRLGVGDRLKRPAALHPDLEGGAG